jgi:hypothetical protein
MKINPLKKGKLTEKAAGIGTVTREMVVQRATEIAVINGRPANKILQSDWDEAKRELTGGEEIDWKEAELESAPESERWDPVPGFEGHKVAEIQDEDEDSEGRTDAERLFQEGLEEAEHERMVEAAEEPRKPRRRKRR